MAKIVAGTGHRPEKLGGYEKLAGDILRQLAIYYLEDINPDRVISGMALGWDTAIAEAAITLDIPLTAAIPFEGQQRMWPTAAQMWWKHLVSLADVVHIVSPGGYAPSKMQARNVWMVDHATVILAMWDGTSGGTANCIKYAKKADRPIVNAYTTWAAWK